MTPQIHPIIESKLPVSVLGLFARWMVSSYCNATAVQLRDNRPPIGCTPLFFQKARAVPARF
jgi:hypothetical protein